MFATIYQSLIQGFKKSWFRFFFYNTALAKLIAEPNTPSAWEFFNTYLSSWWLTRIWFRSLMEHQKYNFDNILECIDYLKKAEIFNEENLNTAVPRFIDINALSYMHLAGILNQENFTEVMRHTAPLRLAHALSNLHRAGILTPENRAIVASHANVEDIMNAVDDMRNAGILNQDYFTEVMRHTAPLRLAHALSNLHRAGILTPENRAIVILNASIFGLDIALRAMWMSNLLNQDNFTAISAPNHQRLLRSPASNEIWARIPWHLLTQANFQRLLTAAEQENPIQELRRVRDQILDEIPHVAAFNRVQSTHTVSVHQSASDSAEKLIHCYGNSLNVDAKIKDIKNFVKSLNHSLIHQAAKDCIARITQAGYNFTDPASNVSIRELLALAYTAIHDASKRFGTLEDAKTLFIQGLYEIQRGYNLNNKGIDQGGSDLPICSGGTFNKLIEKLNGIHEDVSVLYITPQGAAFKFPILSKECAVHYLKSLASPQTAEDYCTIKDLFDSLKNEKSLEPIWEAIKLEVHTVLWDEFSMAYGNNPNHPNYISLIDSGVCIPLTESDLSPIESILKDSPGYHTVINKQKHYPGLVENSIFTEAISEPVNEALPQSDERFSNVSAA